MAVSENMNIGYTYAILLIFLIVLYLVLNSGFF